MAGARPGGLKGLGTGLWWAMSKYWNSERNMRLRMMGPEENCGKDVILWGASGARQGASNTSHRPGANPIIPSVRTVL